MLYKNIKFFLNYKDLFTIDDFFITAE